MQIGSLSPDHATSIIAQQGVAPPPTPLSIAQHKDKGGDNDNSTTGSANTNSGKQVNVVA